MTQKKGFKHLRRTILASNGTNCFLSSSQKTQKINDYYIFKQKPFNIKDLHSITPSLYIYFFFWTWLLHFLLLIHYFYTSYKVCSFFGRGSSAVSEQPQHWHRTVAAHPKLRPAFPSSMLTQALFPSSSSWGHHGQQNITSKILLILEAFTHSLPDNGNPQ